MSEIKKLMNGLEQGLLADRCVVAFTQEETVKLLAELKMLISDYDLLKDYAERQFKAHERRMNETD